MYEVLRLVFPWSFNSPFTRFKRNFSVPAGKVLSCMHTSKIWLGQALSCKYCIYVFNDISTHCIPLILINSVLSFINSSVMRQSCRVQMSRARGYLVCAIFAHWSFFIFICIFWEDSYVGIRCMFSCPCARAESERVWNWRVWGASLTEACHVTYDFFVFGPFLLFPCLETDKIFFISILLVILRLDLIVGDPVLAGCGTVTWPSDGYPVQKLEPWW